MGQDFATKKKKKGGVEKQGIKICRERQVLIVATYQLAYFCLSF